LKTRSQFNHLTATAIIWLNIGKSAYKHSYKAKYNLNTEKIQPPGQLIPKIARVSIFFGEPMHFTGDSTDPFTLREATDKIMRAIGQMSGQEYVDIYASRAKEILREDEEE
jgi:hypothetical protein